MIVPGGAWCDVIDTTVTGNLVMSRGSAGVRIAGSTVDGNLVATGTTQAADPLSAGYDVLCNTTVKGDVTIRGKLGLGPVVDRPLRWQQHQRRPHLRWQLGAGQQDLWQHHCWVTHVPA